MNELRWLDLQVILSVHDMQIAEHGGLPGIRDSDLLESALARPRQLQAYDSDATLWQMGAAYALGISSNHPFADGNKRTALMAAYELAVLLKCQNISIRHVKAPEKILDGAVDIIADVGNPNPKLL